MKCLYRSCPEMRPFIEGVKFHTGGRRLKVDCNTRCFSITFARMGRMQVSNLTGGELLLFPMPSARGRPLPGMAYKPCGAFRFRQ